MLAHKAEEEGIAAAEIMAGKAGHVNYHTVPGVVYTHPELAQVGLTEADAIRDGYEVKVGKFPMAANGRALSIDDAEGVVKVVGDARSDRLLGVQILAPHASDMIAECVVAMEFAASVEDLARSFHAHPTLEEAIKEAALAVEKRHTCLIQNSADRPAPTLLRSMLSTPSLFRSAGEETAGRQTVVVARLRSAVQAREACGGLEELMSAEMNPVIQPSPASPAATARSLRRALLSRHLRIATLPNMHSTR